jgi:hypothetical protein
VALRRRRSNDYRALIADRVVREALTGIAVRRRTSGWNATSLTCHPLTTAPR